MNNNSNKSPKEEIGSFSIKYLKSLFFKETKEKVPELKESFINRRYYNKDNLDKDSKELQEQQLSLKEADTSRDKLTEIYISEIRGISQEKINNIRSLLEEQKEDLDSFIEKNSRRSELRKKRDKRKNNRAKSVVSQGYVLSEENNNINLTEREQAKSNTKNDENKNFQISKESNPVESIRNYGKSSLSRYLEREERKEQADTVRKKKKRRKAKYYTIDDFRKDFNEEDLDEYEYIDEDTYKDFEKISRKIINDEEDY